MKRWNLSRRFWISLGFVLLVSFVWIESGCQPKTPSTAETGKKKVLYQCSMHPTVVSETPDNCPICGMRLTRVEEAPDTAPKKEGKILYYRHPMKPEILSDQPAKDEMGMDYIPVYEGEEEGGAPSQVPGHAAITLSPERQQLIGVQTAAVEERPLALTIRAVGRVAYDPELYNTLAEYREAKSAQEKVKESPLPGVRERGEALVRSAELKLRLLGLNEAQREEFSKANEGATSLLLPKDIAWVYADIYEYETGLIAPGQKAQITTPALPRMHFEGSVKSVDPILNAMTRTLRVRIEVPNQEQALKPEMFVDVVIEVPLGSKLAIPEEAVLDTGERQLVFVDKGEGRIEPREVRVGYEAAGYYEVLSGLSKGERVISSANFLIDSESRLRAAVKGFTGEQKEEEEVHHH